MKTWLLAVSLLGGTLQAQTTGEGATQTVKIAKSNNWQNWVFASSMLLTAAGALIAISMDTGHVPSDSSH